MCPPWTWTTAFNRGRHWSTALLMSCWSRLAQQVHILSFRSSKLTTHRTELRDIPDNFSVSMGLLLDPGLSSWLCISSATRSIFCYVPQSSAVHYRPSERSSSLCQIYFVQKISSRTDCPILVRKLFTNMFCTPSFFLAKEFNRQFIFIHERHVYQQTVT